MTAVERIAVAALKPNERNARTHAKSQIKQIAESIRTFGFVVPVLVDENNVIIAGHGRYEAAKLLGLEEVPAIRLKDLSPAKRRALALADNKIAENAGWDRARLAAELPELSELLLLEGLDVALTGFAPVEIDQILLDHDDEGSDPDDTIDPRWGEQTPVSQPGDLWLLGKHRLACADARDAQALARLMGDERATMAFADPPYNLKIASAVGRGRTKHDEFAMGSGELSRTEFVGFLKDALASAAAMSRDGAVHYVGMDWRNIDALIEAGKAVYPTVLNLIVWVKNNQGQGSFYRSQHELIAVFRVGDGPHLNNVQLGRHGRSRTNVWRYPGVNTFRVGRMDDLRVHPTVKPVKLVSDAMLDCTRRGDAVLDSFSGSGTTILAAEQVGRRAFGVEIEPRFVDVAIRRWQSFTKADAVHAETGLTFDEAANARSGSPGEHASSRRQAA